MTLFFTLIIVLRGLLFYVLSTQKVVKNLLHMNQAFDAVDKYNWASWADVLKIQVWRNVTQNV